MKTVFPIHKFRELPTPFYYYDTKVLRDTLACVNREVARYDNFSVHYAVKANANSKVLTIIRESGLGADCVSGGEIRAAIKAGFPAGKIVFAGVGKADWEINLGLDYDIFCFNVESVPELEVINELAAAKGKVANVAFRINPNVGAHTHANITTGLAENKFGISMHDMDKVIDVALELKHVKFIGLHFHIGSQILDMGDFIALCNRVNELQDKLEARHILVEHINVGGGLGIDYAQPTTSYGDITRYFAEQGILFHGKELIRPTLAQMLRNPVYVQADLDVYEFFKSQGTIIVNDAADFTGMNGCYLYQGRDVKPSKKNDLKDQMLVLAPHEGIVPSDIWLTCRKKLMNNMKIQSARKATHTWLAGKIKCGNCGYALMSIYNPSGKQYLRCTKRLDNKSCPGCGKIITSELEAVVYQQMVKKLASYKTLTGKKKAAKANPKITALQVELAHVDSEIEKLVDSLTGANNVLFSYVNVKIAELDGRKQELLARIAELTVEAISPEQVSQISGYLDTWENVSFDDKRRVVDLMITTIAATSDSLNITWKI